ncbi:MAG TPA: hypothetical protein DF383_12870 [Deltaproteobacteria bacterium]|nr:hypothetical protein [Deltaproteobacteria bacterium]
MRLLQKIGFLLGLAVLFAGCAGNTIFPNIPLTLDPIVLANPIALAVGSTSQRLYVVNSNNQVLWLDASFVILELSDPVHPTAIAAISIPNFSGNMILDEARGFVYLPNRQSPTDTNLNEQLLRININEASPDFLHVDVFASGFNPFGAYYDGVGSLFVAAIQEGLRYNVDDLSGYTLADLAVTDSSQGPDFNAEGTRELSLSSSGNFLFVTNRTDNMLILDVNQFTAPTGPGQFTLGTEPVDYIVTGTNSTRGAARDANFIYIVDGAPPNLRIMTDSGLVPVSGPPQEITTGSMQVAAIPLGLDPGEVILDETLGRAYVSNTGSDDVSVIDLNLQTEIDRVPVDQNLPLDVQPGDEPFAMATANIGGVNFLYVANYDSDNITVINADTLSVVNAFPQIVVDDEEDEKNNPSNNFFDDPNNPSPGFDNI